MNIRIHDAENRSIRTLRNTARNQKKKRAEDEGKDVQEWRTRPGDPKVAVTPQRREQPPWHSLCVLVTAMQRGNVKA